MDLTCSSFVSISSCRDPTCCSLEPMNGYTLGTYVGIDPGSPEG